MKKVAFLLVCVLCGLKCLVANPVPVPSVYINEIMFDSEKGWMLELLCYGEEPSPIVKMTVFSSSGSAESKYLPVGNGEKDEWSQLFVLTRDSMESNLDINPLGDEFHPCISMKSCLIPKKGGCWNYCVMEKKHLLL